MNNANCLMYCIEFKGQMPTGDKVTASHVLDIVKKARSAINSMDDANAVLAAKSWADVTLAA